MCSDSLPVQNPFDLSLGPVDSVVVHSTHCTAIPVDRRILAVELARIALAIEVVGDVCGVSAHYFDINLIQIVAQEDHRADDALSTCSLEYDLHSTKHDVECGLDSHGIALLYNGHCSSLIGEADQIGTRGEVEEIGIERGH